MSLGSVYLSSLLIMNVKVKVNMKVKVNIATGETSQAITSFHFFDYFDMSNVHQYLNIITSKLSSLVNFHH